MQNLGWYVSRIRSMSPSEILWRVNSLLRDYVDVFRSYTGWFPRLNTANLAEPDDFQPGFRFDLQAGIRELPDPAWKERLLAKAERVLEDQLSFFDLENVHIGDPVQWHTDFSSGITGPMRHRTFVNYRNFPEFGDCKLVWEPNRHHQLVVLARAYRVTGDERFAQKVVTLIRSWSRDNPFGYGMNWKSPMEVAIRNINWIVALDLLLDSPSIDRKIFADMIATVYLGSWDTERRLSRGSSSNNHLIGEAAGIFIAASWFPDFPQARRWQERAKHILEEEIHKQTYDDGCTREHAFGYMFFVIQFLTLSMLAGQRCGVEFSARFKARLHQMYSFLAEVSVDTGLPPGLGDADDGYVLDLGELPRDAAQLITVGAELFADETLRLTEGSETAYWLTAATPRSPTAPDRGESVAFDASGYFLLRSGGSRENEMAVFFDCAELGYGTIAAHGHADCLAFTLSVGGHEIFVDGGTYDYFTHPQWRDYFRSSRAHNTLVVDGQNQSEMTGPFMWGARANAAVIGWQNNSSVVCVYGEHDGYRNLPVPAVHRRTLRLDKSSIALEVTDEVVTDGAHMVERYLHLAPQCIVEQRDKSTVTISRQGHCLLLEAPHGDIEIIAAADDDFTGWISQGYHRRQASTCIRIIDEISHDATFKMLIRTT
jgi:hypothetical protein